MEEQARTDPPRPQPTRGSTEPPRERSASRPRKAPPPAVLFQPPAAEQPAPRKGGDNPGGRPEREADHPAAPAAGPKPRKAAAGKAAPGDPAAATAKTGTPKPSTAAKNAEAKSAARSTTAKSAKPPAKVAKKAARKATAKKAAPEPLPGLPPQQGPTAPTGARTGSAAGTGSAEPAVPPQVAAPITERTDSPAAPRNTPEPAGETSGYTAADQPLTPATAAADQPLTPGDAALVRVGDAPDLPADLDAPDLPAGADRPADLAVCVTGPTALAVLRRFAAQPAYAPELLALAAVQSLGPAAQGWAAELRATYPHVTTDGLVRLATGRYDRMAKAGGALASLAGFAGPVLEGATIAWTQAGLLLHLAAAHDRDPTHPDRAAELLAFTGVHPDLTSARDAVRRAVDATGPDTEPSDDPVRDVAEAGRRLAVPLAWQTGGWAALRLLTRRLPGAGTLLAGIACADANRRLAARAIAHYRATAPGHQAKIVS